MAAPARLVVVLPALDELYAGHLPCPPGLERILQRGVPTELGGDAGLAEALGLAEVPAAGPRAALAADRDVQVGSCWMRVDPVHLQPDLTAVWLRGPAALDWSAESMGPLHRALGEMFDGPDRSWMSATRNAPGRLRLDRTPDAEFTPLHAAVGARLDEVLPRGGDAARWHGLINEAQMTFHQFRRLDDPNPAGLGLWPWGAGELPARPAQHAVSRVVAAGDASEGCGLARWFGHDAPSELGSRDFAAGTTLVEASLGTDTPALLPALDSDLFEPAWRALKAGRLRSIRIVGHACGLAASRWSPFAFWRRGPAVEPE